MGTPVLVAALLEYVNATGTVVWTEDVISINSCIAVDLYGRISVESTGLYRTSCTGGQLVCLTGVSTASGGKDSL